MAEDNLSEHVTEPLFHKVDNQEESFLDLDDPTKDPEGRSVEESWSIWLFLRTFEITELDRIFRFLVPFVYIIFCFAYFSYYMNYN